MSVETTRTSFLIDSLLDSKPKEDDFIEADEEETTEEDEEDDEQSSSEVASENDMDTAGSNEKVEQEVSPLQRILAASLLAKCNPMIKKANFPLVNLQRPDAVFPIDFTKHLHVFQQAIQLNALQNLTHPFPMPFVQPLLKNIPVVPKRVHARRNYMDQKNNLKKYRCDVCEKTFSRSNTLITHKRIHTGEKPFKCEHCGRAFRQPGNLTRHRLTHTTVKPYVCGLCEKAFNRASNLHTHMRTHSTL